MKCDPQIVHVDDDCTWTQCSRCGLAVKDCGEVNLAVWESMPDCGVVFERVLIRHSIANQISKYALAVAKWVKAGRPVRDQAEVDRIFHELCRPCRDFDGGRGSCQMCGCKVNHSGGALRNKISMATESCPRGKWGDQ